MAEPHRYRLRVHWEDTDAAGQTFQKNLVTPDDQWAAVTIYFADFTGHWGGPDDGKLRGRRTQLNCRHHRRWRHHEKRRRLDDSWNRH